MTMPELNWLDVLLLLIFLVSVATAMIKGLTREVIRLVSAVAGLIFGILFYGIVGSALMPYVSSRGVAHFCGFLIVFFSTLLLGSIVSFAVGRLMKVAGLTWADRALGGAFGVIRAVVISVAILLAIVGFAPGRGSGEPPESVVNSRFAPYVMAAADLMAAVAPKELKDEFRKRYDQVQTVWKQTVAGVRDLPRSTH